MKSQHVKSKETVSHWPLVITLIVIVVVIVALSVAFPTGRTAIAVKSGTDSATQKAVAMKSLEYPRATEIVAPKDASGYHNLPAGASNITIQSLIGKKVILVDFWTYTCINCQRTLPYLTSWYDKYSSQGLEIIGIHTPEFDFEKDPANVEKAILQYGIKYPVVQDNDYQTWRAYNNQYWPHEYLIDIDGFVVHDHIGEGGYEETEQDIQKLLAERAVRLNQSMNTSADLTSAMIDAHTNISLNQVGTPEIYAGYAFDRGQFGQAHSPDKTENYTLPAFLDVNYFYLTGLWHNDPQAMMSASSGSVFLTYTAKQVNIVAGTQNGPLTLTVLVDGKEVAPVTVDSRRLYTLYNGTDYSRHALEIRAPPGLELYTFTFG